MMKSIQEQRHVY